MGIGNDCAVLAQQGGQLLFTSTDTLVQGTHFFPDADATSLGHKSLAVNLSDLAACGATPVGCLLALTLPAEWNESTYGLSRASWLESFSSGLLTLAAREQCPLIGGDTTSVNGQGPIVITITVFGQSPQDIQSINYGFARSGAQVGDDIWVSGELGSAAYALHATFQLKGLPGLLTAHCPVDWQQIVQTHGRRLHAPEARLALGQALRGIAHSALDVSDGLWGDLSHILQASQVGATVWWNHVPRHASLNTVSQQAQMQLVLCGGDDYELCFTTSPSDRSKVLDISTKLGLSLHRIGIITADRSMVLTADAASTEPLTVNAKAYEHF